MKTGLISHIIIKCQQRLNSKKRTGLNGKSLDILKVKIALSVEGLPIVMNAGLRDHYTVRYPGGMMIMIVHMIGVVIIAVIIMKVLDCQPR